MAMLSIRAICDARSSFTIYASASYSKTMPSRTGADKRSYVGVRLGVYSYLCVLGPGQDDRELT